MSDQEFTAEAMRDKLRLLVRELQVTPVPPPAPAQPWRTCANCDRRPRLTYVRAGHRYCPDCWDRPT
jgi:hypothetical protein